MPRSNTSRATCLLALPAILTLPACTGGMIYQEQVIRTDDMLAAPGPFRPTTLRVHPLTHTQLDAEGDPVIILHLELKDLWGDTQKAIGQLQVQLRQPRANNRITGRGTRWDIDLRNTEKNVSYFDSATRTYRIVLGGLPDWLGRAVLTGQSVDARLRVLFRTAKANGDPVVLQDEYEMR